MTTTRMIMVEGAVPSIFPPLHQLSRTFAVQSNTINHVNISVSPGTAVFKQTNFLFATSETGNELRNIEATPGTTGTNYIIFGASHTVGTVTLQSSGGNVNKLSYGMTIDTEGARSLYGGGDYNGDGKNDLLIGDPSASMVYVLLGRHVGNWNNISVSYTIRGTPGSGFGWAVTTAGDFNRDGIEDIFVSALYSSTCYVLFGRKTNNTNIVVTNDTITNAGGLIIIAGTDPSIVYLGVSIACLKDINGDGSPDLGLTAETTDGSNYIYIIFGQVITAALSILTLEDYLIENIVYKLTAAAYSFMGLSIDGAGDVNGDGCDDIIIGSIPYESGYDVQRTYVIYGKPIYYVGEINLSNVTSGVGYVINGGGIIVSGVGDLNRDGYADIMVTYYPSWVGKPGSYLIVFPSPQTYSPTYQPTSQPSEASRSPTMQPSSSPSMSVTQTQSPHPTMVNSTLAPSRQPVTRKPSVGPTISATKAPSFHPSRPPTKLPTPLPSLGPTVMPTVGPTVAPSFRPSRLPTFQKTSAPTSHPSQSPTIVPQTTNITTGGYYEGMHGNQVFLIESKQNTVITGKEGAKRYVIYPEVNVTITITDFNNEEDVLDLSLFTSLQADDLSYTTNPLSFKLPNDTQVILSSHENYDLSSSNLLFNAASSSSSSSSGGVDSSISGTLSTSTFSTDVLTSICGLVGSFIVAYILVNWKKQESVYDKYVRKWQNRIIEKPTSKITPLIPSNESVPPSLSEPKETVSKVQTHNSRIKAVAVFPNTDKEVNIASSSHSESTSNEEQRDIHNSRSQSTTNRSRRSDSEDSAFDSLTSSSKSLSMQFQDI